MKKKVVIVLVVLLVAAGAGGAFWYWRSGGFGGVKDEQAQENEIFADSVGVITGTALGNGRKARFTGVVEPQKTEKIELAEGMKVKENYVTVGQEVKEGAKLFAYDTEEAQDSITKLEIDIENSDISIETSNSQIKQLEKERDKSSGDTRLSCINQIMALENSVKRSEHDKKSKQADIDRLKRQIADSVVTSPVDGVIKSITKQTDNQEGTYVNGEEENTGYMTIMATGAYRIKGKVNEMNRMLLQQGERMKIHSRIDETQVWVGTVSTIDTDKPSSGSSSDGGGTSENGETSSTYPFYVELESSEGLMLGQHIYMELDTGEEEETGMWLDDYYLITDEQGEVTPYVWAVDGEDKLEKRQVTLGEYNQESMKYQISDGLTPEDYIVFPSEELREGRKVIKNEDMFLGGESGISDEEGMEETGDVLSGLDDSGEVTVEDDDSGEVADEDGGEVVYEDNGNGEVIMEDDDSGEVTYEDGGNEEEVYVDDGSGEQPTQINGLEEQGGSQVIGGSSGGQVIGGAYEIIG